MDATATAGLESGGGRGLATAVPPSESAVRAAEAGLAPFPHGWVSQRQAAAMFGVSICTWRRWEQRGWVRSTWVGNYKLYDAAELQRQLDENGRYSPPYPDPERPGVYRVPLSNLGMQRREAIIDAESLPLVEGRICCLAADQRNDVAAVTVCIAPDKSRALRRLVMNVGDEDEGYVGHINGDALDCRRENLVVRTMVEQLGSLPKMAARNGRPCSSRYKGVSWCKQTRKWRAAIIVASKHRSLGRYHDEAAAAEAYDQAAREIYGKHAWLNFPDGVDARLEAEAEQARRRIDGAQSPAAEAA